jgi:iron complex outermembrane receptor protein
MKVKNYTLAFLILTFLLSGNLLFGQTTIKGKAVDEMNKEPLFRATILVKGHNDSAITDIDGNFELKTNQEFPFYIQVRYVGYEPQEIELTEVSDDLVIKLSENSTNLKIVDVVAPKKSDKQKANPLSVGTWNLNDIKNTASVNPYEGMKGMPGVDSNKAGMGYTIINTRGFNSTSPVRTLQIIDGVDNQAPGLNFSLGNFLGNSELDLLKIDLISGASSPFYGPNAFNGVISMETKNPFIHKGLSAIVKAGDRNLKETAFRYANSFRNKDSLEVAAFKLNFAYMQADDWVADNYEAVYDTRTDETNPGRWDAVNIYGDEYQPINDGGSPLSWTSPGLGIYHRVGYKEEDLVDYDTKNIKANIAFHFRTKPDSTFNSPEIIFSSNFGSGTTVYQGDNRFSLKDILFFQNRLEFRKRSKFFIRAYATHEDAGRSYDPYFTALKLQENAKDNRTWGLNYSGYWRGNVVERMYAEGYPKVYLDPSIPGLNLDTIAALAWLDQNQGLLADWHTETANATNLQSENTTQDFFEPGTDRFNDEFNRITSANSNAEEKGTRFYDKSALYHLHGEYIFDSVSIFDQIIVGANGRIYKPNSKGTIFYDTAGITITNREFGAYLGLEKAFFDNKLRASATIRIDKNENFNLVATPAASLVWKLKENNYFRLSFSSAIRNPTLSDQYLNLNVGPATLSGNLNGVDSLITPESLRIYRNTLSKDSLVYFSLDPIQPEKVKTFELGYRTTLFNSLYLDAGYYFNIYDDFIGYRVGVDLPFINGIPQWHNAEAYRYSANSKNQVTTQGFTVGLNYYFSKLYQLSGNYSWNKLNTKVDDSIIPAFNTPEHKFNLGFSGRDIDIPIENITISGFGFNVNYKWIEGFLFEGSPQFTGHVPTYDLLDAQINLNVRKIHTTFKLGASNLLNNKQFQTYGGPKIGRLAYFSILYEFKKI